MLDPKKIISPDQLKQLAEKFGIGARELKVLISVETSGSGFDKKTGEIIIQFEPAWFYRAAHIHISNGVELQAAEWRAFNQAHVIDPNAAMTSTSWGLGQIMGFNYASAGYASVKEMVDAFQESEYKQVDGMLHHIQSKHKLYDALKHHDWKTVAFYYNGEAYQKFNYDKRLAVAFEKIAV